MAKFTEQEVIERAKEIYKSAVCLDMLDDAMKEKTVEEAAMVLVLDSSYWDGKF